MIVYYVRSYFESLSHESGRWNVTSLLFDTRLVSSYFYYFSTSLFTSLHFSQRDLVPFFKVIENEPQIASMIVDYSISQTTLEEVFMTVYIYIYIILYHSL